MNEMAQILFIVDHRPENSHKEDRMIYFKQNIDSI